MTTTNEKNCAKDITYVVLGGDVFYMEWDNGIRYNILKRIKQKITYKIWRIKFWLKDKLSIKDDI